MKNTSHQQNLLKKLSRRGAFTVIELVVVVLVIAILAAMLLPAINGARVTARNAQVTVDIKALEAAIANFKLKYGVEPPSSFLISDNEDDYQGPSSLPVGKSSLAIMRSLWPDFNPLGANNPAVKLSITGRKHLNGAECLVFFLGGPGMYDTTASSSGDSSKAIPTGFSANPADPFSLSGGQRVGPFYEFKSGRLSDIDSDGFFELLDPLPNQTQPYQYISSYSGKGYQPNGADNTPSTDDDEVLPDTLTSAYFQSFRPTENLRGFWNPKGYQIISPGRDGEYGIGGGYREGKFFNADATQTTRQANAEKDNITNFSGGPLSP